jgi:hypothetical protein
MTVKFRSLKERDFMVNILTIIKHLEENELLGHDGRQRIVSELMKRFNMANVEIGSSLAKKAAETDESVDKVGVARILLELAIGLPTTYWATLAQHQACLSTDSFSLSSSRMHKLWRLLLEFVDFELKKPRDNTPKVVVGTRVEARFKGRKAYFPATVIYVHPGATFVDLKYDSTFARSNSKAASKQRSAGSGTAAGSSSSSSSKDLSFSSSVLDDGETEYCVSMDLCNIFPESPRTPREDSLLRVVAHLQRLLRLGTERPVELQHHRRHFLPPVPPPASSMIPNGQTAVLWRKSMPVAVRGLFDVNRDNSLVFGGKYGPTDRQGR